jgi:hypothetical protein
MSKEQNEFIIKENLIKIAVNLKKKLDEINIRMAFQISDNEILADDNDQAAHNSGVPENISNNANNEIADVDIDDDDIPEDAFDMEERKKSSDKNNISNFNSKKKIEEKQICDTLNFSAGVEKLSAQQDFLWALENDLKQEYGDKIHTLNLSMVAILIDNEMVKEIIQKFPAIRNLNLEGCDIDSNIIEILKPLKLDYLNIKNCPQILTNNFGAEFKNDLPETRIDYSENSLASLNIESESGFELTKPAAPISLASEASDTTSSSLPSPSPRSPNAVPATPKATYKTITRK